MTRRDLSELLLLGALWGASFLFMRMGATEFGPIALSFLRVAGAALVLLPLLLAQDGWPALRQHWRPIALVGLVNSALPFALFTAAALALSTALMAVFNATAPIWAALLAWAWLGERLGRWRWMGLGIGIVGVVGLSWDKADFQSGALAISPGWGIVACIAAAMCYGLGVNLTRRHLSQVPPMAVAAGSQIAASLILLLPALATWPRQLPGAPAWAAAAGLAFLCTGLAYMLYFRLIRNAGATNAISVTFLIPAFAMAWGWLLLDEVPTPTMLAGGAVILLGTALASGLLKRSKLPP